MFEPLTRDYWPNTVRSPYRRLALAILFGPLVVVALVGTVLWGAWMAVNPLGAGMALFWELMSGAVIALYILTAVALPVIVLLWSTRVRALWAYALAGLALGFAAAALHAFTRDQGFSLPAMAIVAVIGAIHLVVIRTLAGIRAGPGDGAP